MNVKLTSEREVLDYFASEANRFASLGSVSRVHKLSGGYANYVYRLILDDSSSSLVLKHFSTHVASAQYVPMSPERYFVEKRALQLAQQCIDPAELIRTPRIVAFDDDLFALILEDCGDQLRALTDLLKSSYDDSSDSTDELIARIIRDTKRFLNRINDMVNADDSHRAVFSQTPYWTTLNENFPHIIQALVDKFQDFKQPLEQSFLGKHKQFVQPLANAHFVHGDLWSNSFLIDFEKQIVWLLDWEASRLDTEWRDLQTICSSLWLMRENEKLFSSKRINHLLRRLQLEFLGDESADWRRETGENVRDNFLLVLSYALLTEDNLEANLANPTMTGLKALAEFKDI